MKHVPHLYLPPPWIDSELIPDENQSRHLARVLRIVPGSSVTYTDGAGKIGDGIWDGTLVQRGDEQSRGRPSELSMAVAPPASKDRVRFIVEKLAELGVQSLDWLETRHGNRKTPSPAKQGSWAISALEQSRGAWLLSIGSDLASWSMLEFPLAVCQPGGGEGCAKVKTLAVGPEGGFEPDEIPEAAQLVDLGETILRVETAAIVAATKFR